MRTVGVRLCDDSLRAAQLHFHYAGAQGIEVGLVAQLAGHANPNVTLGHYTQVVRGGEVAMAALERAYDLKG